MEIFMFINREFIGNLVTIIFFVGIVSTLFCLTGTSSIDQIKPITQYGTNPSTFVTNGDSLYGHEN